MMPENFINTRDTYIAQLQRITDDENARQVANYDRAFENYKLVCSQIPVGNALPPAPIPALAVGLAFDNQNNPVITLGPGFVCEQKSLPKPSTPSTELNVVVGPLQDEDLGIYGVGVGDNAPAGFVIELEDGETVKKMVKKGPFGSWKWYQRI